jgi:PAT family beta-lactamase induction signal transducer AmpG
MPPRRLSALVLLGFASGLPLYLTGSTLKAWLTKDGLDLKTIGFFSLVTLPYSLKFLWAPVLDRYVPPLLGRRRGWMLVAQGALVLLLAALAVSDPRASLGRIAFLAVAVAFASASQDIATDAWRAEALPPTFLGMGNAIHIGAYRLAMLVSGAGALILADRAGWRATYLAMAALMAASLLGTLLAPNTDDRAVAPRTLREAVVGPLAEFFSRPGFLEILAFCILYKIGDQLADSMTVPFLLRGMGFSLTVIGATTKTVGITFIIVGGLVGGWILLKLSLRRALWLFGFVQAGSVLAFWALSRLGPKLGLLVGALALENLAFGMGGAAFAAFLMGQCDKRFTGTQYALLTSLMALSRSFLAAPMGELAKLLGWSGYFLFCAAAAIPGLLLLLRWDRWRIPDPEAP